MDAVGVPINELIERIYVAELGGADEPADSVIRQPERRFRQDQYTLPGHRGAGTRFDRPRGPKTIRRTGAQRKTGRWVLRF